MPILTINNQDISFDQQLFKYRENGCKQAIIDTFNRTRQHTLTRQEAYALHCEHAGDEAYGWSSWQNSWADLGRVGIRKFSRHNNDMRIQWTSTTVTLP